MMPQTCREDKSIAFGPTTREADAFPSEDVGAVPSGTAAAAIFVMLIEDVFVARIASGRSSAANERNIEVLISTFSEAAYGQVSFV